MVGEQPQHRFSVLSRTAGAWAACMGLALLIVVSSSVSPATAGDRMMETIIRGIGDREQRLQGIVGEAVHDTFYGPRYWEALEGVADAARRTPEEARDRDRMIVRFNLSPWAWRVEAQSLFWGGSNVFFPAQPQRAAGDVDGLYMFRGATEDGTGYAFSRQWGPRCQYAPATPVEPGWLATWPARWLGMANEGAMWLSRSIGQSLESSSSSDPVEESLEGVACWRMTVYSVSRDRQDIFRTTYWVASSHGFAPVRVEQLHHNRRGDGASHRSVAEWSDFRALPGGSVSMPRRHTRYAFVYTEGVAGTLDHIMDIRIAQLYEGDWPAHDLVRSAFPVGARLVSPVEITHPRGQVTDEYSRQMTESGGAWATAGVWATTPWADAVPAYPPDWDKGLSAEEVADMLRGAGE